MSEAQQGVIHFYMTSAREIRRERPDGLPGALLGRFLPEVDSGDGTMQPLSYRLTPANKGFVEKWIAEGAAVIGVRPGSFAHITGGQVRGRIEQKKEGA